MYKATVDWESPETGGHVELVAIAKQADVETAKRSAGKWIRRHLDGPFFPKMKGDIAAGMIYIHVDEVVGPRHSINKYRGQVAIVDGHVTSSGF